jgi:uncharacterized membrane protein
MSRRRFSQSLGHRADQAGILVAGANVPLTFQRTLMPRPTSDQAIVTGLSIAANHALVSLLQESIQAAALLALRRRRRPVDDKTWSRATLVADLAAVGAGLALQRRFRQRAREPLPRAAVRTGGFWLSLTGAAATLIGALQEVAVRRSRPGSRQIPAVIPAAAALAVALDIGRRRAERLDADLPPSEATASPAKALGFGAAVAIGVSAAGLGERAVADGVAKGAARLLPVDEAVLRPLGHALALAGIGAGTKALVERVYHRIEHREESVESAFDVPPPNPLVSGSFDSAVAFDSLSRQGRRYVWMVNSADRIRHVMNEADADDPIRVYVGLESAETEEQRVGLALDELDRTGAFERAWLLIDSPTGTGYVNYAAISALELLARGNCATVAMQYAARPSVLSLDRVGEGRRQAHLLLDALHQRMTELPADRRPQLVLFGESLGAWASQDPFVDRGTQGLVDGGIDHSIWIGTPHFSKWKEQVLNDERPDVDAALVGVFNDIGEWHALDTAARERIRYVMITHHDDGVARFGPELAIQAPDWLGPPATRPSSVPRGMRWMPSTSFFQVLVDMKNSANVVPGKFAAKGHDYRADLVPFFNATLGFGASHAQVDHIAGALEQRELGRTDWIKQHGAAGKSLAGSIVEQAMHARRAQGADADAELLRLIGDVAEREFGAGGGANVTPASGPPDAPPETRPR